MDLAKIVNETETVTLEFSGESVTVSYRPNYYTLDIANKLDQAQKTGDLSLMASILSEIYASWTLTRDGVPVPTTAEGIASVPMVVLNAIDDAVLDDMKVPSDEEKRGSLKPTPMPPESSTPDSGTSPNGSESSSVTVPQPEFSASPSPT